MVRHGRRRYRGSDLRGEKESSGSVCVGKEADSCRKKVAKLKEEAVEEALE